MESAEIKDVSDLHAAVGPGQLLAVLRSQCVPVVDASAARLDELLAARQFSTAHPPPPERVIYRIGDATIATPGNLVCVYAQPKAGKTAFIGGVLGSTMEGEGDTFGVDSSNPDGLAVIHMDTEQSPQHHHKAIARACQRMGRDREPEWLYSYRLADVGLKDRRAALHHEIQRRHAQHGGIHSIFLDGIADFILDVNDPEEAFGWVDELHRTAIQYDTVIVCVLHENPNNPFGKTRGHLGSQLERKAETNLRLVKDADGVTTVFTDRSRQAHIPQAMGPRFSFCPEKMMHISCETKAATKESAKAVELRMFATEVFADTPPNTGLAWGEIIERIRDIDGLQVTGARKRLAVMVSAGVINHSKHKYYRGN
jgi:hypothetical protein